MIELETEAWLATGGEAVARHPDGRVVFVRGAAPKERLQARIVDSKPRFARAEVDTVLGPGPDRVVPDCPVADRCGGCGLLHLERDAELTQKHHAGLDTLTRVGRLEPALLDAAPLWAGRAEGVRMRARLAVRGSAVGFRAARSHDVVPVDRCRALDPALESVRIALSEQLRRSSGRRRSAEVSLVTDGVAVSGFVSPPEALALPAGVRMDTELPVEDRAGSRWLHPRLFSQATEEGNAALLAALEAALPRHGGVAVELHAGSGNFTRLLVARFERVVAVEIAPEAVALGRRCAPQADWIVGADDRDWQESAPDLLLVDPPRTGLSASTRAAVIRARPKTMLYISCDVGTLARDLRALRENQFSVQSLAAFDLYPRTPHLEWMAALRGPEG